MKKGFTLAEVLVTLTIIGVIAAVTISALYANVQKNQAAVQFSKAINSLENANRMLMQQSDVTSLGALNSYGGSLMKLMAGTEATGNAEEILVVKNFEPAFEGSRFIAPAFAAGGVDEFFTSHDPKDIGDPTPVEGDESVTSNFSKIFVTKDGILYAIHFETNTMENVDSVFNGNYYTLIFDINGTSKPNQPGRDQFKVLVDFSGAIIPYGGSMYKQYTNSTGDVLWKTQCIDTTVTDGYACTGSIVDNNYKITYKY